jgi:hypothetical protein
MPLYFSIRIFKWSNIYVLDILEWCVKSDGMRRSHGAKETG